MQIIVSIAQQRLTLTGEQSRAYDVSTALVGPNELENSGGTPRGRHIVRAKIGDGRPLGTVFLGRRATGEIYSSELAEEFPSRDWVLSRILWLSGCEVGKNRLGNCDTMRRFIYIHGTPDSEPMGVPKSHGCIRMRNADVMELFDLVPAGTEVLIEE